MLLLCALLPLQAKDIIEDLVYSAGTTWKDAQNRHWAYLLWQGSEPDLVKSKTFAVYMKSGDANSAALYQRKAVVRLQTDANVIDVLLNRSVNLGENLGLLEERLNNLFQKLIPPANATLAQKLAIIIQSSLSEPEHYRNLILMGRVHPGVSLCLGFAYADQIPAGKSTFEAREYDPAKDQELAVVGRVTVEAGNPTILPAPGAPVEVPEFPVGSAKGDLNIKLRWAIPDPLRRLSLLGYGFNAYRITKAFAQANNYHLNPPAPGVLADLALKFQDNQTNPPVCRVNRAPVLKSKDFDAANVANFDPSLGGDNTTYFNHDDNRRYEPGGAPFVNGDQFYYYVTARDILGRDGLSSPGTLITVCDRLPPLAPRGVIVENDYSKPNNLPAKQVLKVSWKPNSDSNDTHTLYYAYRWSNATDYHKDNLDPAAHPNLIGPPVAHDPSAPLLTILDDGPTSPQMPADAGRTFWYTVRVRDNSACGGNFSPHTGPTFGVLRDREGPGAPSGSVGIICCRPLVTTEKNEVFSHPEGGASRAYFRVQTLRRHNGIEWAEFYAFNTAESNLIAREYFAPGAVEVSTLFSVPQSMVVNTQVNFYCRVSSVEGDLSNFSVNPTTAVPEDYIREVNFVADMDCRRVWQAVGARERCRSHHPQPPGGGSGTNECIELLINLAPGTKELKVYKRVEFGPLTMFEQTPVDAAQIIIKDCVPLANPDNVCYFAQAFDEHGNWSVLAPIGDCISVGGSTPLPKPLLSPIEPKGNYLQPLMRLRWFCPTPGVDRFEVSIAVQGSSVLPDDLAAGLSLMVKTNVAVPFKIKGQQKTDDFFAYHSRKVGISFGDGPQFTLTIPIELGKRYYAYVRAIGKDGAEGPRSNAEQFVWTTESNPGPLVPWPDRNLPTVEAPFDPNIIATNLPSQEYPVGIRIGSGVGSVAGHTNNDAIIRTFINPLDSLYDKDDGTTVLPVVLYRYQVPNADFPTVSGDVIQASPLMEKIAYEQTNMNPYGPVTIIRDPFIGVYGVPAAGVPFYNIYLLDTQPMVIGARYAYLLVRFGPDREIEEVIPTNEVEL